MSQSIPTAVRPGRDTALNRTDHLVIGVDDLTTSADWYRDTLGLTILDRSHGQVVLSCDGTLTHLVLVPGGPGLRSFAIGASDRDGLERFASAADAANLPVERVTNSDRPGIDGLIRVSLPDRQTIEVVTRSGGVAGTVTEEWTEGRLEPLGIDHVGIAAEDPSQVSDFLAASLPFDISEKVLVSGDVCLAAFVRTSSHHHDVSVIASAPTKTLHHFAFAVGGMRQFETIADRLADRSTPVEHGPLRHGAPSYNLAMYTKDPDGNRIEFTAEMRSIPWGTGMHVTDEELAPKAINLWSPGRAPEEFFTTAT